MNRNTSITKATRKCYVKPDRFFSTDDEKTKLNWMMFEYAQEIESYIQRLKRLKRRLVAKGIKSAQIADFCVDFAKSMEPRILDICEGRSNKLVIDVQDIEKILPKNGEPLAKQVLPLAVMAWDRQVETCVLCPQRCLKDWNAPATMFEDSYYYD